MLGAVLRNECNILMLHYKSTQQIKFGHHTTRYCTEISSAYKDSVPGKTVVCETTTGVISDIYMNIELRCIKLFSWLK